MVSASFADSSSFPETVSAFATVFVQLVDENDNVPVFDHTKYHFEVPENYLGPIGSVKTSDLDSDLNAVVTYTISDSKCSVFVFYLLKLISVKIILAIFAYSWKGYV